MEGFVSLATKMGIGEAGITAIFGYLVVFVGLSLLMLVIYLIGAGFQASAKKKEAAAAAATPEPVSTPEPEEPQKPVAPGSAGHVKRFDVLPLRSAEEEVFPTSERWFRPAAVSETEPVFFSVLPHRPQAGRRFSYRHYPVLA